MGANAFLLRPRSRARRRRRRMGRATCGPGPRHRRPEARVPAEIADLVDATQRSVERVAAALEAEKRHAAEAAHALRTPVAVLTARLDALPPGETTGPAARRSRGPVAQRCSRCSPPSRAEALTEARAIDLRLPAETVTATLAPFAYGRGIGTFPRQSRDTVMALARSRRRGTRAVQSGGERHPSRRQGAPWTSPSGRARSCPCAIAGPGLPEDAARSLFDPFWRGPGAAPGGAGLGLAIVARVQRAQGRHRGRRATRKAAVPLSCSAGRHRIPDGSSGCRQAGVAHRARQTDGRSSEWSESNARTEADRSGARPRLVVGRCPGVPEGPRAGRGHHARPSRRRARLTPSPGFQQISWKHTDETALQPRRSPPFSPPAAFASGPLSPISDLQRGTMVSVAGTVERITDEGRIPPHRRGRNRARLCGPELGSPPMWARAVTVDGFVDDGSRAARDLRASSYTRGRQRS